MAKIDCTGCGNDLNGKCEVLMTKPKGECWARTTFQEIADRYSIMADRSENFESQRLYENKAKEYRKYALLGCRINDTKKEPRKRLKQIHTKRENVAC